jgi:hypothetical protein
MKDTFLNRKGASRTSDVPAEVLALLNEGSIASVNLTEWLVTDQFMLAKNLLPKMGYANLLPKLEEHISREKKPTSKKVSEIIARTLLQTLTAQKDREGVIARTGIRQCSLLGSLSTWFRCVFIH